MIVDLKIMNNGLNQGGVYTIFQQLWIKKQIEKNYLIYGKNLVKEVKLNIGQDIVKKSGQNLRLRHWVSQLLKHGLAKIIMKNLMN